MSTAPFVTETENFQPTFTLVRSCDICGNPRQDADQILCDSCKAKSTKVKTFWEVIADQLAELETAQTADDVCRILANERNPYGPEMVTSTDAFFAGSGGDGSVRESLYKAGWKLVASKAYYYWAMRAPNGDCITYVEGDIYRGNHFAQETETDE